MLFNKEDLETIKYIPTKTQRLFIETLESDEINLTVVDPTSPFVMLLEANVISTLNAIEEVCSVSRKLFPSLASNKKDLYHHISTEEEKNLFSSPSETNITFMINKIDLESLGVYDPVDETYKATIPKYTEIQIADVLLTTINDIEITLKDNQSFVEQKIANTENISINTIGNLYSIITMDDENTEWIIFETKIKQIKRISYEFAILHNAPFSQKIPIEDNYYYSEIFTKNINDEWVPVNITHTDIVYDHTKPTVKVEILDGAIEYKVPDFYIIDGTLSGLIRIDIYTTKGKILLPLSKFNIEDFRIKLPNSFYTNESAVMKKIDKLAFSKNVIDGGVTTRKLKDLRNKIIFNTTGTIDLPITEKQLNENAKTKGFTLYKAIDTITDRIYIAGKNINDVYNINTLSSNIDIFNNTVTVQGETIDTSNVVMYEDSILIKSNTVFKSNNGNTLMVSDSEIDILNNNTLFNNSKTLRDTKYYYTPFYYMLDLNKDVLNSRIYDLDNPVMKYVNILNKNQYFTHNVNISRYGLFKIDTGYKMVMSLFGNAEFDLLNPENVFIQIGLRSNELSDKVYFVSTYDAVLKKYIITIDTDLMIDTHDRFTVTNGQGFIYTNKIYIDNEIEFIIYTTDNSLLREDRYEPTLEIYDQSIHANALCKESGKIKFGNNLNHLWNKITSIYTDRKFLKADHDKYLRYKADVFNTDIVNSNGIVIKNSSCSIANIKLLHQQGDIVLDTNGEPLYEYRIGDILLDDNNTPTVDFINGIIRYVDILMFQYEYKLIKDDRYTKYATDITDIIINWTLDDVKNLNDITLEHTQILYKPRKSNVSALLTNNKKTNHLVKPKVILYMDKTIYNIELPYSELISSVGKIIHKYIEKRTIIINDIKEDIIKNIGNGIVGVKITNIDSNDTEILAFSEFSNRLSINKVITISGEVSYDIDLNIEVV